MPEIGKILPSFTLPCVTPEGKKTVSSDDFTGKPLVLFFYPRDDTPGCTREAGEFSAMRAEFDKLGVQVLGISKDSVKSHAKFIAKHDLKVGLLSDENSDFCERMGVWGEKKMYGKTFMGITRSTFLVDSTGILRHIWPKVKVPDHVTAVLEQARAL